MKKNYPELGLSIGWKILFLCSIFITTNGIFSYISTHMSLHDPLRVWKTGMGFTDISMERIKSWGPEFTCYWIIVNIVAAANLTMTGITLGISALGLRKGARWGWYMAMLLWVWVGLNDTVAVIYAYQISGILVLTAPIPLSFGGIALLISAPKVFRQVTPKIG